MDWFGLVRGWSADPKGSIDGSVRHPRHHPGTYLSSMARLLLFLALGSWLVHLLSAITRRVSGDATRMAAPGAGPACDGWVEWDRSIGLVRFRHARLRRHDPFGMTVVSIKGLVVGIQNAATADILNIIRRRNRG